METTKAKKIIRSRLGVGGIILFSIGLVTGLLGIYLQISKFLRTPDFFFREDIFISLGSIAVALFSITQLTLRIEIEDCAITFRNIWRRKTYPLSSVEFINLIPTTYGIWFLSIKLKSSKNPIPVSTPIMANEKTLIEAIVELAHVYNPSVVLDERLTKKYGYPPYKIFYQVRQ